MDGQDRKYEACKISIREAQPSDFAGMKALYAQLQPDDPAIADGSDLRVFEQILNAEHLMLFVLEGAHRFYESCGFEAGEKFALVARPAIQTEILRKFSR